MGLRKGVYAGFWCPPELKRTLEERGQAEHRTLSQEIVHRLARSVSEEEFRMQDQQGEPRKGQTDHGK